jgi:hypothetical protein
VSAADGVAAAVSRAVLTYALCVDHQATGQWTDCFTAEASVEITYPGRDAPSVVLHGIEQIVQAVGMAQPAGAEAHIVSNLVVDVGPAPDTASAHSAFLRVGTIDGALVPMSYGRYEDVVVLGPDGMWRLARRQIHLIARRRTRASQAPP